VLTVDTRPTIVQFNTSPTLGGAEVYTAFFTRALLRAGWRTRVVVDPHAGFWNALDLGGTPRTGMDAVELRDEDVALVHASMPPSLLASLQDRYLIGVAHQAMYDAARPAYYDRADLLLSVTRHVTATLAAHGLNRVWPEPLYGVADLDRTGGPHAEAAPLRAGRLFDADLRKPRDRLLAAWARARDVFASSPRFAPRPGLTLGVVSRIAALKQFPLLFDHLVPVLRRFPNVNLEIFGTAVGYKALISLRTSLSPLGTRVRYWGHQTDVAVAYRALDYLLLGLPEREALGLNALEACAAGTPVLAVEAPPFTETLVDGVTGFFYTDPRRDGAAGFAQVLDEIVDGRLRPDREAMRRHTERFSIDAFSARVDAILRDVTGMRGAA
jgi:glycosyltransferase involved in cell wall biosynthesis